MFAPIDKAANNVAIICKHFYVSGVIKELNLDCIYQTRMIITPTHL